MSPHFSRFRIPYLILGIATLVAIGMLKLGLLPTKLQSSRVETSSNATRSGSSQATTASKAAGDSTYAATLRRRILAGEGWRTLYDELMAIQDEALRDSLFQVMAEMLYKNRPDTLSAMLNAGGLHPAFVAKVGPLLSESIQKAGGYLKLTDTLGFLSNDFISAASQTDPHLALAWVNEHIKTTNNRDVALLSVTAGLARIDPAEALRQLDTIQDSVSKSESAREIARSWAASADSQAALDWAKSLPEGDLRTNAMEGTLASLSAQNPQVVLQEIAKYGTDKNFAYIGYLMGDSLAAQDPPAAMDAIRSLPDGPVRQQALESSLQKWGQIDFDKAESFAASQTNVTPREIRRVYKGGAVEAEPSEALQRIQSYSDVERRQQAIGGYVEGYMLHQQSKERQDALVDFANNLPAGTERDYAQAELANYYFSVSNYEETWNHALKVKSPELQAEAIFAAWWMTGSLQGPEAANARLANQSITPSQVNQIQTMIDQLYSGGVGAVKTRSLGFKPGGLGN